MSAELDSLMVTVPVEYSFTQEYRNFVESLLPILRNDGASTFVPIGAESAFLYKSDLEGFLLNNGVPLEDHYLVMRVNDIDNSFAFDDEVKGLLIPDAGFVGRCKSLFTGKMKK